MQTKTYAGWFTGLTPEQETWLENVMHEITDVGRGERGKRGRLSQWWLIRQPSVLNPPTVLAVVHKTRDGRVTKRYDWVAASVDI